MITNLNQRWRDKCGSYRPAAEVIRTSEYEVAEIRTDTEARDFVLTHHYSSSYPAARFRFGLYRRGTLVGVAVFSHPSNDKTLTNVFPGEALESIELGRFVLLDTVPGNGETWFQARCREQLRAKSIIGLLSFSDDQPRTDAGGRVIFGGHVGTIYQASNAIYLGRGTSRTLHLLPDGRVLNDRTKQKLRKAERGWEAAAADLETFGAPPAPRDEVSRRAWLTEQIRHLTHTLRHPGNHKYAWALHRSVKLPKSQPYPKFTGAMQGRLAA